MVVADKADGFGVADVVDDVDAASCLFYAEAMTGKDFLVALSMQLGEALTELKLLAIDGDGAEGTFLSFHGIGRQGVGVNAEEVTHTGALHLQITRHTVVRGHVDDVLLHGSEDIAEHVVEMDAYVGGNAAAFVHIPFPGGVVPVATGGDVGEVHIVDFVRIAVIDLLFQGDDGGVQSELQDIIDMVAGLLFHLGQSVNVPGA